VPLDAAHPQPDELGRVPVIGDEVVVELRRRFDHDGRPVPAEFVRLRVRSVERHVPGVVAMERVS
jgi:hypothetical protein